MNRKRAGTFMIVGGFIVALLVAALVWQQVSAAQAVLGLVPTRQVVIATMDIPARTEIAASMVKVVAVPNDLVQAGAATHVEDVVTKFSPTGFVKGEVINTQKLGPIAAKNSPSFTIPKGKVMYVMPVSFAGSEFGIAKVNALRAGDRVDLLYTTINTPQGLSADQMVQVKEDPIPYLQTRIMLQDLRIQEIGTFADDGRLISASSDKKSGSNASATADPLANANIIFIVDPEQALVLKWLKDAATYYKQSNIEMVLRSPSDTQLADNSLLVNFQYMEQKYHLSPPPPSLTAAANNG